MRRLPVRSAIYFVMQLAVLFCPLGLRREKDLQSRQRGALAI
jgi:hypothetical protein